MNKKVPKSNELVKAQRKGGNNIVSQRQNSVNEILERIDTDVLITHTPVVGYLDQFRMERWECGDLLKRIEDFLVIFMSVMSANIPLSGWRTLLGKTRYSYLKMDCLDMFHHSTTKSAKSQVLIPAKSSFILWLTWKKYGDLGEIKDMQKRGTKLMGR